MALRRQSLKFNKPRTYRISAQGVLAESWQDYVQGMIITITQNEEDEQVTTLTGELVDQAAVMGVLNILYNLRMPILSIDCISTE